MIDKLNEQYGIDSELTFEHGPGGLTMAMMTNRHGSAALSLHGAHVLSYTPHGGEDLLWMSRESLFAPGEPIRGGIPVCWPWFGAYPGKPDLPAHGFVRRRAWRVVDAATGEDGSTRLRLRLDDDEASHQLWPHRFSLQLLVTLGPQLRVALTMENPGDEAYTCTSALHSYFSVGSIDGATVNGLDGTEYIDTVGGRESRHTQDGPVHFSEEVDRIYLETDATCTIEAPAMQRRIRVAKEGSQTTVVWNPWIAKAARMPDFGDDEYRFMLCVETANARGDEIRVEPGGSHTTVAIISSEAL